MNALSTTIAIFAVAFSATEAKENLCGGLENPSSCCGPEPCGGQLPLSYSAPPCVPHSSFPPTSLLPVPSSPKLCVSTPPDSYQKPDVPGPTSFHQLTYSAPSPSPYHAPCVPPPIFYPVPYSPLPISSLSPFAPQSSCLPSYFKTTSINPSLLSIFNTIKSSAPSHTLAPPFKTLPPHLPSFKPRLQFSPKFIPVQLKPKLKASSGGVAPPHDPHQPGLNLNPSVFANPLLFPGFKYGPLSLPYEYK